MERFVDLDVLEAHREFVAWPTDDDTIFSRLRIWACGNKKLIPAHDFGPIIASLSDDAFWDRHHQRDFLLVLVKRWPELSEGTSLDIETRLLKGPPASQYLDAELDEEIRATETLDRITWLANNDCRFTFDLERETKRLRAIATRWRPEDGTEAARSQGVRGGRVTKDVKYLSLLKEPLDSILSKALEMSGSSEDFLVRRDPFAGLSCRRPVRALSALTCAAKRKEYPEWAWRTFLSLKARKGDKPKFSALIAERVSRYPNDAVSGLIVPASGWVLAKPLIRHQFVLKLLTRCCRSLSTCFAYTRLQEIL